MVNDLGNVAPPSVRKENNEISETKLCHRHIDWRQNNWSKDWLKNWLNDWLKDWLTYLTKMLKSWIHEGSVNWLIDLSTHWLIDWIIHHIKWHALWYVTNCTNMFLTQNVKYCNMWCRNMWWNNTWRCNMWCVHRDRCLALSVASSPLIECHGWVIVAESESLWVIITTRLRVPSSVNNNNRQLLLRIADNNRQQLPQTIDNSYWQQSITSTDNNGQLPKIADNSYWQQWTTTLKQSITDTNNNRQL